MITHGLALSAGGAARRRLLALGAGALLLPPPAAAAPLRRVGEHLFGSPVELLAVDGDAVPAALADALRGLRAINARFNAWKPGELATLNRALREGRSTEVTPEMRALIVGARELERRSAGHFNAGIGGLVAAWGFHDDVLRPGPRPSAAALEPWRAAAPSLSQLRLDGLRVRTDNPRLQLDFGGYAKGVAADRALDRLATRGVRAAVVDLGGNLAAMGDAGGRPWRIGLRDPGAPGLIAQLAVSGREAVITSGTYERFRLLDGERASHVIDPARGVPAAALVSVTVVHRDAGLADAAATALLVAGVRLWPAVAQRLGVSQVLVVDRHLEASATPSLAARLVDVAPRWRTRLRVV